jgi:hypothetical protein
LKVEARQTEADFTQSIGRSQIQEAKKALRKLIECAEGEFENISADV